MTNDFSKIKEFWGERLHQLSKDYLRHLGLNFGTNNFLTTVGLPIDLNYLSHSIEINFYSDEEKIVKKEFKGVNYIIIGNDTGTEIGISVNDNNVYALDFNNSLEMEPVCFINSSIDKFVESIRCFIEFKKRADNGEGAESQLVELMKERITSIDKEALVHEKTWWRQIIDDPIRG